MRITQRRRGWEDLFATRTRGDVGEGLGSILALSTATDLISFSGGFPDPAHVPRPRSCRDPQEAHRRRGRLGHAVRPHSRLPGLAPSSLSDWSSWRDEVRRKGSSSLPAGHRSP
jgi:hypothetical protein